MKRLIHNLLFVSLLLPLASGATMAEPQGQPQGQLQPQGHGAQRTDVQMALRPGLLVIDDADCRFLPVHVPDADVAYTPGFDVNGRAIAPADLASSPSPLSVPEVISFNLLVQLKDKGRVLPEASVGNISVDLITGLISANGRPLNSNEERALVAHCHSQH